MARLVTSGFELQSLALGGEGQGIVATGSPVIETSVVHSGVASLKAASLSGAHNVRWTPAAANQWTYVAGRAYYGRVYLRISANPAATLQVFSFMNTNTRQGDVAINSSGQLILRTGGGTTLQASAALSANEWHRVELMIQQSSGTKTTSNGTLELRVNGVVVGAQVTGTDAGVLDVNRFVVGQISGNNTAGGILYFDDVALNDDQGANQNSWPGDGKIVLLKPTADTAAVGLWKKGAGTNTANLWSSVDNTPPTGKALTAPPGDDDQIRNASTSGDLADEVYEATLEGYPTGLIRMVQAIVAVGNSTTTARAVTGKIASNPSGDSVVTMNSPSGVAAGTYPTGWLTTRGNALYLPSYSGAPTVSIDREAVVEELTVALLGAYVEYQLEESLDDTATASDALSVGPALDDTATASEARALDVGAAQADTASAGDALVAEVQKALTDSATVSDAQSAEAGPGLADTATVSDAVSLEMTVVLDDSVSITDIEIEGTDVTVGDSVTVADSATPVLTEPGAQDLDDTATVTDATAVEVEMVVADTATVADATAAEIATTQADTVTVADAHSEQTGQEATQGDAVTVTDAAALAVEVGLADSVTVADDAQSDLPQAQPEPDLGGAFVRPRPRRRAFALDLEDAVVVTDDVKVEFVEGIPTALQKRELILALA